MAGVFERSEFPAITDFAGQAAARIRLKAMSLAASQHNCHKQVIGRAQLGLEGGGTMAGVFERSEFPAITDFAGQAAARTA